MSKIGNRAVGVVAFVASFAVLICATPAEARQWTCHATIYLNNSSFSYTVPSWAQNGGPAVDREKRCLETIKSEWIPAQKLWLGLGVPQKDQKSLCDTGGTFRVGYGFDERKKGWTFGPSSLQKPICQGNHFQ